MPYKIVRRIGYWIGYIEGFTQAIIEQMIG